MTDYTIQVVIDPNKAKSGSRAVEQELNNISSAANRTQQLVNRALGLIGSGVAITKLVALTNQFTTLQNQVKVTSSNVNFANKELDDLFKIANRARVPVEAIVGLYQRTSFAAKELGASQTDLNKFVETVAQNLAIQGGSAQSASGALIQLSQTIGSGIVRAEEFNSILEGAFPIALAAARGLDAASGSVAKLRNLVINGKVKSDEFFRAILSQAPQTEEAFKRSSATIGQALTVLNNALIEYVGKGDASVGISHAIANALLDVAKNIDVVAKSVIVLGVALGITFGPALLTRLAAMIPFLNQIRNAFLILSSTALIGGLSSIPIILGGIATILGGLLLPALAAGVAAVFLFKDGFVAFFDTLGIDGERALKSFAALIEGTVAFAVGLFEGLKEVILGVIADIKATAYLADDAIKKRFGQRADPADFGIDGTVAQRAGRSVAENFQKGFDEGSQGFGLVQSVIDRGGLQYKDPTGVGESGAAAKAAAVDEDALKKALERRKKLLEEIKGPQLNYKRDLEDLNILLREGKITNDEFTDAVRKLNISLLDVDKTLTGGIKRGLASIYEQFTDVSSVVENSMVDAFQKAEDALVEFVKTGKLELDDLFESIVDGVARIYVRDQITAPIAKGLGSLFDSSGSGGGGPFDFLGDLFGFASGGSFQVGGNGGTDSQVVAFRASPDERVTVTRPDQQGGGGNTYINIQNNSPAQVSATESREGNNQSIQIMIDQATASNIQNSGSRTYKALQQNGKGRIQR